MNKLEELQQNKDVVVKQSKTYPSLYVAKYKRDVFYNNTWTDVTKECRGHVYHESGKLVVAPFTKIYNMGENNTFINRDNVVVSVDKINGFMAAVTYVPEVGDVVVSTTGSLDSEFVQYAKDMLKLDYDKMSFFRNNYPGVTYLFEIVHPEDPHIVPEVCGAYLIGCRFVDDKTPYFSTFYFEMSLDDIAARFGFKRPSWKVRKFDEIVNESKTSFKEGYVCYDQITGTVLKIKTKHYLTLKAIARKKDILSLDMKRVDEEYYPLLKHLMSIKELFNEMEEQERLDYIRNWLRN